MKKAFLETNAIWRFFNDGTNGEEARAILSCHGFEPVMGLHAIYELARTFLMDESPEISMTLFSIVRDLKPLISEEPQVLLRYEFQSYLRGGSFDPFLWGARKNETAREISKFSNGVFDEEAQTFITKRDEEFKTEHAILGQYNIELFQKEKPKVKLKTFEDVVSYYKDGIPQIIEQILTGVADARQSHEISKNLDRFPALKSTVMANLYTIFIAIVHQEIPGTDKIDDHRHIIEASYCDLFVTEEKQLLKNVQKINPSLTAKKWSDIGKRVEIVNT